MNDGATTPSLADKLALELRRGTLVLATLSQLRSPRYGYSLLRRLADRGLEIEQGTLYPLLRRLAEQGVLEARWNVDGSRPRKYYQLSRAGLEAMEGLTGEWNALVDVMTGLLEDPQRKG